MLNNAAKGSTKSLGPACRQNVDLAFIHKTDALTVRQPAYIVRLEQYLPVRFACQFTGFHASQFAHLEALFPADPQADDLLLMREARRLVRMCGVDSGFDAFPGQFPDDSIPVRSKCH